MAMGAISMTDVSPLPVAAGRTEERIRAAALECIARQGISRTTVDDVVREAGVSRATLYRAFPGGKDTLVEAVLGREVHRFFAELAGELARHDDAEGVLVAGVGSALSFLATHPALRAVLANEPGLLLSQVAFHRLGPILDAAAAFTAPHLRPHIRDGHPHPDSAATEVAELLVRVVLTYALQPSPHVDPADDDSVARLVRRHLLPALTA
jgi:AcrR family transcriptional regulator